MRWSAGVFVALIGLVLVAGTACRKLPTDNNDRNRPPETYLSAAPVDSINNSGLIRIPYRYRAHWSGSDLDGEVVGFFVAVTETTVDQTSGQPFKLPPPKPQDYKFTTKRDSLFTFDVSEGRGTDRQHALYVYAVDNQGKVDPTPAVTHFVARDQNLPGVRFIEATTTGTIFNLMPGGGVVPVTVTYPLTDGPELPLHSPRDTIPSGASVHFKWRGFDNDFASGISGYRYKLFETDFVKTDSTVTSVDYGTPFAPTPGVIPIGLQTFRLIAVDEAGGSTQPDSVRQFIVNFSPDTWLAGPDPNSPALAGHLLADQFGTYFPTDSSNTNWGRPFPFPGNPMTDTLTQLPAERPATDGLQGRPKTIMEQRTLLNRSVHCYIRSEKDTVAFGSLIVARFGGSDKDSPYRLPGGNPDSARVYQAGPANGSPTGFQARVAYVFPNGGGLDNPFSTPFPNIDPFDALFNHSVLFTVDQINQTGDAYIQFRAVDGDRSSDNRIGQVVAVYESASTSAALRSKIFKFYTNFNPGLLLVSPARDSVVNPAGNSFQVVVRATDPDPDPTLQRLSPTSETMFFSLRARAYAASAENDIPPESGWQDPVRSNYVSDAPPFYPYTLPISLTVVVPDDVPSGPAILEIEVVDNVAREKGRIVHVKVPIFWRTM
jgi:hypothetical protein